LDTHIVPYIFYLCCWDCCWETNLCCWEQSSNSNPLEGLCCWENFLHIKNNLPITDKTGFFN